MNYGIYTRFAINYNMCELYKRVCLDSHVIEIENIIKMVGMKCIVLVMRCGCKQLQQDTS